MARQALHLRQLPWECAAGLGLFLSSAPRSWMPFQGNRIGLLPAVRLRAESTTAAGHPHYAAGPGCHPRNAGPSLPGARPLTNRPLPAYPETVAHGLVGLDVPGLDLDNSNKGTLWLFRIPWRSSSPARGQPGRRNSTSASSPTRRCALSWCGSGPAGPLNCSCIWQVASCAAAARTFWPPTSSYAGHVASIRRVLALGRPCPGCCGSCARRTR